MKPLLYGVVGRFLTPEALIDAILALRDREDGVQIEAYAPYAVDGLTDALRLRPGRIPFFTLLGGLVGGIGGFLMQWYAAVVSFPVNVGGRPLNSWPMFIPVTFELAILCAALTTVFGMLWGNGLPRLYHPIFNTPFFDLATRDRFFLCIRPAPGSADRFDVSSYRAVLDRLGAIASDEVWS